MAKTLLEMRGITKTFPGVKALNNVNFQVAEREIHAIVGENGAGKSTLMNVLSGIYPHGTYTGDIVYDGEVCKFNGIKDSERKGIVIIHQELALVPWLSIGENMFLGNERKTWRGIDWDETWRMADSFLDLVGLHESSRTLIKDIGVGKQQLVEIAKALAKNVRLLILDEPTASLNESDSKNLLDILLRLKTDGVTSIIISHKLNDVEYVADRITVIRDGETVRGIDRREEPFTESVIISAMVGRALSDRFPPRKSNIGEVALEIRDWTVHHPLYEERKVCNGVNLTVRKGEIVGIAGLIGAGRTEMAMSVFGRSYGKRIQGHLFLNGKEVHLRSVREAIDHKLAYVTEDRKGNGLLLNSSIALNTTLAKLANVSHGINIDSDLERVVAEDYVAKLHTKCAGVAQNVGNLSGGNQQKVLIGKWIFTSPDILIMDEPTRGIDVGAKYEIYCIMNDLVAEGKSVLMISSEMPELLGMCDRIYVMNEGRIVGLLDKKDATQEAIMTCILRNDAAFAAGQAKS